MLYYKYIAYKVNMHFARIGLVGIPFPCNLGCFGLCASLAQFVRPGLQFV